VRWETLGVGVEKGKCVVKEASRDVKGTEGKL
jgi:hypothetical protein